MTWYLVLAIFVVGFVVGSLGAFWLVKYAVRRELELRKKKEAQRDSFFSLVQRESRRDEG